MGRTVFVLGICLSGLLYSGCSSTYGIVPMSNQSMTQLDSSDFKVVRAGLRGEASCTYLFGFIPLSDPGVASLAVDDLVQSAQSEGKSVGLVNFAGDVISAFYFVVTVQTVKVRADAAEFTK
jgi:hypothetical protein